MLPWEIDIHATCHEGKHLVRYLSVYHHRYEAKELQEKFIIIDHDTRKHVVHKLLLSWTT